MYDIPILIITIISATLTVALLIICVLQLRKSRKPFNIDVSDMQKQIREEVLNFSERINRSLNENQLAYNNNINETKISLIKELSDFKEVLKNDMHLLIKEMQENVYKNLEAINKKVDERLSESFEKTNKSFAEIIETISKIETARVAIESLTGEVSGLQNILSNNQSRGAFGEFQLNQILSSILGEPGNLYAIQYSLNNANEENSCVRADAVVFLQNPSTLLCIDSKFPYSAYSMYIEEKEMNQEKERKYLSGISQEVKKHIKDIAQKYLIKGLTTDYALMFVPADGILALLHAKLPEVIELAFNSHVVIVSPTTLAPTLFSYKVMILDAKRSKQAKEVVLMLDKLSHDFAQFSEIWGKIKKNVETISTQTQSFDRKVEKISKNFKKIANIEVEEEDCDISMVRIEESED